MDVTGKCLSRLAKTVLVLLVVSTGGNADDAAHGLWGVGVQIGTAEASSYLGADPANIVQSLIYARELALQSGCIPTAEIDELIAAMRGTKDSRTLFARITAYRQRLANYVVANCNCQGTIGQRSVVGDWDWFTGNVISIKQNGTLVVNGEVVGQWKAADPGSGRYTLTWNAGYVDNLNLSADGNKLEGTNQNGTRVTATRKVYMR